MRLVPHQSSEEISDLFKKHFEKIAPDYVKVTVTAHHGGDAVVTPTDSPAYKAAAKAIQTTFGKDPIPTRGGGSIPIIALFEKTLGLKTVLLGFGKALRPSLIFISILRRASPESKWYTYSDSTAAGK